MIEFRARSILLLLGAFHGILLAGLLAASREQRAANRVLAGLIALFVLRITPYIIGFAGFYDAYPWLTFAPFDLSLALGPLLYLYVRARTEGGLPARWAAHLVPGAVQLAYYTAAFALPLEAKWRWSDAVHEPWIVPVETAGALLSMAAYLAASWRRWRGYQEWLGSNLSNGEQFRLPWIRDFLAACSATLGVWCAFEAFNWGARVLTYLDRFPLYLWLAGLVYYLGLSGWKNAALRIPVPLDLPAPAEEPAEPALALETEEERDWSPEARRWAALTAERGWFRDPELTLAGLARKVGTNSGYLSRALNQGLGQNFSEFINRLRVEAVKEELSRPGPVRDLLVIALDAGFNSKASFNRAFRAYAGTTPSAYRQGTRSHLVSETSS